MARPPNTASGPARPRAHAPTRRAPSPCRVVRPKPRAVKPPTGQAPAAMAADGKTFVVGTHELFPIPNNQIIASNGRLTQNPGY